MNKKQLTEKIKEYIPIEIIQAEFTSDPDKRDYIVSSQKFYNVNNFSCQYNLDDGIKELMTAYSMIEDDFIVHANY